MSDPATEPVPADPDASGDDDIPEMPEDDPDVKAWTDDPLHRDVEDMDDDEVGVDDVAVSDDEDDDDEEDAGA